MTLEQLLARNNIEVSIMLEKSSHWTFSKGVWVYREYHATIQNSNRQRMKIVSDQEQYSISRLGVSVGFEEGEDASGVWEELHAQMIKLINSRIPCTVTFPCRRNETPLEIRISKRLASTIPEKPESFKL